MGELIDIGGGVRLDCDDVGSGRPVLLIHGVSMSRRFFERNLDALAERFRVVNVDLRGHGESPACEGGHTVAQYARDVHALIEQLGLHGVVLVGWSMGTMVAWELIRRCGAARLAGHVNVSQGPSDLKRDDWPLGAFTTDELFGLLEAAQDDFRPVVGSYERPTLCSWGRDEKLLPIAAGEWLAAHQPADRHVLERSGHGPMWEEPELWNHVVGEWIAAR